MNKLRREEGFTLIEILVVVALVAILAAATIIAINPAKNFAQARDTERLTEIGQILSSVTQYTSEQGHTLGDLGTIPACTATPANIGDGTGDVDLEADLVDEYIPAMPIDPQTGVRDETAGTYDTGYTICQTSGGRVQIEAPSAEGSDPIIVK